VITTEKIEEWILEVQERPASAPLIIQYIANRLRDLNDWNEKLRTENIELRSGNRVSEYERQIINLEYQLELIKRQIGGGLDLKSLSETAPKLEPERLNLLIYGPEGRILRLDLDPSNFDEGYSICRLDSIHNPGIEPPRPLLVTATEELMFIFTSGRIITLPAAGIPLDEMSNASLDWENASIPEEPTVGDSLACVVPISRIALSDFYLQISRRGYTKKIRKALAASIMENKYIGTGVKVPADQTLNLSMNNAGAHYAFVSYEGYLQFISEEMLPYAIVEAMRLGKSDHLVAAFPAAKNKSIIIMTQIGKVIHRTVESLETASELQRKGRMLYSNTRRESGVRVVGAAAFSLGDWSLALHQNGNITLHDVSELIGKGSIPVDGELFDFIVFPGQDPPSS
jgi:DNA gyrase/topoisomerase IV subunit A